MNNEKDYYGILHVPTTATSSDIKEAYRLLISALHPDKFQSNSKRANLANKIVMDINEAFDVLKDTQKREEYDLIRRSARETVASSVEERVRTECEQRYTQEIAKLKQEYNQRLNFEIERVRADMESEIQSRVMRASQPLRETIISLRNEIISLKQKNPNESHPYSASDRTTHKHVDSNELSIKEFMRVIHAFLKGRRS